MEQGPEAASLVADATARGATIATAESLTAGLVAAAIADVPGASAVLRGGVVAYHGDVKVGVLGVESDLLAERGSVDPEVALRMAAGARRVCGATIGVSTTGVAGPEPHDGKPVGRVYVAWESPWGAAVEELDLSGTRDEIRRAACRAALAAVVRALAGDDSGHMVS
ncbi:CinA family protein [Zhihengliuella salsuginis]|uniref:Competence damage-inducible protein A n=1 Tax=Zhihengliuella salsuginis TaxID=578222 RepID=A0ABQ3GHM3_9MICC|nr:CinA family protein [Zhihengliuella salsuginis]GHD07326.1 competence damage-inducible protein A [Zhihengliuella salsuginis]